jgi:hypothetical protein
MAKRPEERGGDRGGEIFGKKLQGNGYLEQKRRNTTSAITINKTFVLGTYRGAARHYSEV